MEEGSRQIIRRTKLEKRNFMDKFLFDETMEDIQVYETRQYFIGV